MSERVPESATRRLRADRSRQTIQFGGGIHRAKRYNLVAAGVGFSVDKPDRIPLRSVVTVLVNLS